MNGDLVFADTSGFLALLDADDSFHQKAARVWAEYGEQDCTLWTSDYVRLESWSLIQRRLGSQAAMDFFDAVLPACSILQIGEEGFALSVDKWRIARRRNLSLVDITSFHAMRRHHITRAFAFDDHFVEEGFQVS